MPDLKLLALARECRERAAEILLARAETFHDADAREAVGNGVAKLALIRRGETA
jgi:hypothetical protein